MSGNGHFVYRIWYGDQIVYVGRTNQPLQTRIHGHLFCKPMHRKISIDQISRIEYAAFESEADMNLYELYYILKLHPVLNVDDKTRDFPTVHLPDIEFQEATFKIWDKWKQKLIDMDREGVKLQSREREIQENLRVLRSMRRLGDINEDEFYKKSEPMVAEIEEIRKKRMWW